MPKTAWFGAGAMVVGVALKVLFDTISGAMILFFVGALVMVLAYLGVIGNEPEVKESTSTLNLNLPVVTTATLPTPTSDPVHQGRLKLSNDSGSVRIPPGMGYSAQIIQVTNIQGKYPNTCHNVRAELQFTFVHTGETRKITGQFVTTDGQSIKTEPTDSVSLRMLETAHLVLLARNSIGQDFRTFSKWPFNPYFEDRLEFGEWALAVRITSDSNEDRDEVEYNVTLSPNLSSSWIPLKTTATQRSHLRK